MTERTDKPISFIEIEATGFANICNRLAELEKENEELKLDNDFLNRKVEGARFRIDSLRRELEDIKNMSMFEFGNTYCDSESLEADGHALARSLLSKPATPSDIAEEEAITNGEATYALFSGDDDL